MGPDFQREMTPAEFKELFQAHVTELYGAGWTLFADSSKGYMPIGVVLGILPTPVSPFIIIGDMLWFPWASRRNKLESTVNFINEVRKEVALMEYASMEDQRFFEHICKYGIMRRVGTSYVIGDGPAAVFETRKVK